MPFVSANGKTLAKIILRSSFNHIKWDDDAKILAQNIHFKSPACFKYLKHQLKINLRCISSIYRWLPIKKSAK